MANPTAPAVAVGPGGITNTLQTMRPTSTVAVGGWNTGGGAPSPHAAMSDDNDATYLTRANPFDPAAPAGIYGFPVFVAPPLAQVRFIQTRMRAQGNPFNGGTGGISNPGVFVIMGVAPFTGIAETHFQYPSPVGTVLTPPSATQDGGFAFDAAFFNSVQVYLFPERIVGDVNSQIFELYFDVWYNQAPVVAVTGPTGTVTASSRPALTHTYTDPENDIQDRYQRKIFARPAAGSWPAGLDPATGLYTGSTVPLQPVVDFGTVFSTQLSDTLPLSLTNGVYRHYVRAADLNSGGRYSAWAFSEWTQNVPAPGAPTFTASPSPVTQRVTVGLTPHAPSPVTTYFVLQRSDDGGVTWTTVIGGGHITSQPS